MGRCHANVLCVLEHVSKSGWGRGVTHGGGSLIPTSLFVPLSRGRRIEDILADQLTKTLMRMLRIVVYMGLLCHFMTCFWVQAGRNSEMAGDDSWLLNDFESCVFFFSSLFFCSAGAPCKAHFLS